MLVVLHGDDGNTAWMDWMWHGPADKHGVVMVVLRCPGAGGYGDPSWSRWHRSARHDPGWLAARIEEVIAREPIDRRKLYASGYSSGASYLSSFASDHPERFAAISLVGGGDRHPGACSACKLPVHFLIGSLDTMLQPDVIPLRDWYQACGGHDVVWELRQGMTHEGIQWSLERGGANAILTWMLRHEAGCGPG